MSTLSLSRLVTAEGRGARARLVGMAAGVAVGVALLLLLWGAYNGLVGRTARSTWIYVDQSPVAESVGDLTGYQPSDGVVLASNEVDHFAGRTMTRVDIAATPASTVVVPGIGRPPAVGSYYASPALAALIDAHPADELEARYGTRAGLIDEAALASPDSLVVVTGVTTPALSMGAGIYSLSEFRGFPYPSESYRTVAIIGAIAILLPVLILVGIVTRLGAAERADRFATLRLIGATPHRVAAIAAVETSVTSIAGAFLGVGLARLLIPAAARIEVEDGRFFPADLSMPAVTAAVIVAGVVAVSTAVAWWRANGAGIGPLGATREQREHRPHAAGVLPLAAGIVPMLTATIASLAHTPLDGTEIMLIGGFLLTSLGLLTAGPLLTSWVAGAAAGAARRTAGVIAMNRIRRHPRATFRAVSGLVAALFMVSVFSVAITTAAGEPAAGEAADRLPLSTVVGYLDVAPTEAGLVADAATRLAQLPGITAAVVGYHHPEDGITFVASDAARLGLPVPDGASNVQVASGYFSGRPLALAATGAQKMAPAILVVATDGTTAAVERARTGIVTGGLRLAGSPVTRAEASASDLRAWANRYANLANLGIVVATIISAVSLAVSTIAAILDRKRVLGLLRLMGMPVSNLRRLILAEAALPLATVFALCVGLGFLVAWCIVAGLTEGRRTVSWPDPSYYYLLAVSMLLAAAAVVGTFRTARKNTGIAVTRFE